LKNYKNFIFIQIHSRISLNMKPIPNLDSGKFKKFIDNYQKKDAMNNEVDAVLKNNRADQKKPIKNNEDMKL
jgi:hypothetical protein